MTPGEHYAEAQRLLTAAAEPWAGDHNRHVAEHEAQLAIGHALLATANLAHQQQQGAALDKMRKATR